MTESYDRAASQLADALAKAITEHLATMIAEHLSERLASRITSTLTDSLEENLSEHLAARLTELMALPLLQGITRNLAIPRDLRGQPVTRGLEPLQQPLVFGNSDQHDQPAQEGTNEPHEDEEEGG